jgi:hypothetical protein
MGEKLVINPLTTAEIECRSPLVIFGEHKYTWYCNGGRIMGPSVKDGKASKIGWAPPGVPGKYTVMVTIYDALGNTHVACTYINVIYPNCCGGGTVCGE